MTCCIYHQCVFSGCLKAAICNISVYCTSMSPLLITQMRQIDICFGVAVHVCTSTWCIVSLREATRGILQSERLSAKKAKMLKACRERTDQIKKVTPHYHLMCVIGNTYILQFSFQLRQLNRVEPLKVC